VDTGDYRFFSTEYDPADCEKISNTEIRPLRLSGLTLTNHPNNRGGKPITNRREDAPASTKKQTNMKKIAEQLGLVPEATEEEVLAALTTLQDEHKKMSDELGKQDETVVNRHLEELGISDDGEKKIYGKMIREAEDRDAVVKSLKNRLAKKEAVKPVYNRGTAPTPKSATGGDTEKDGNQAAKIVNRARQIQKAEDASWGVAFNRAKAEFES
jgi:hypothetical protein